MKGCGVAPNLGSCQLESAAEGALRVSRSLHMRCRMRCLCAATLVAYLALLACWPTLGPLLATQ